MLYKCYNVRQLPTKVWYWTYIRTHIIDPSVRIIDLVSPTTYVVCVNFFIHNWQDLQFKVDSERQTFWETFHGKFLFTLRAFARNLLRGKKSPKKYFSYFFFYVWPGALTLAFRLISQHTTYWTESYKNSQHFCFGMFIRQ